MNLDRQLKYCGDNYRAECEALKRIADNVIKAARLVKEGNAHGTAAHVILIEGERGVGKTRIAMEIYNHLALVHDPEKYWPRNVGGAALQDDVMPRATDCTFDVSPAFVWWGMAIGEGKNPGNTVFKSLGDLLPHLAAAHIAARQRRTGSGMVAELAELGLELGLPVLEAAVELTGLSTIKAIGTTFFKIGLILKGHLGEPTNSLTKEKERVDGVIDSVMDDLSKLFSPGSGTFAGIPLILLVDDAQFDSDPWMAPFVEKLIARSQQEHWPMLLMLTHWSRQLGWTDAQGQWRDRSRVATVIDHALSSSDELGQYAKEKSGSLPQEAFTSIRLGVLEDDMSPAILDHFPGLDWNDGRAISEKAGGNPRKVQQILERMSRKPKWFVGGDRNNELKEQGRQAVMELAELDIDRVVFDRFCDTPAEVRRAMAIASLMGNRFVIDLVDRLAGARFKGGEARPHLAEAEDKYRFLRDVVGNRRNDIASFAETLFLDAAREYREDGLIREMDDNNWPSDEELNDSLYLLLTELARNIDAFPGLTVDDLSECFILAADRMSARDDPLAGLALAHLVRLENKRGNLEGAYEAASRFIKGFESSLSNTQ